MTTAPGRGSGEGTGGAFPTACRRDPSSRRWGSFPKAQDFFGKASGSLTPARRGAPCLGSADDLAIHVDPAVHGDFFLPWGPPALFFTVKGCVCGVCVGGSPQQILGKFNKNFRLYSLLTRN